MMQICARVPALLEALIPVIHKICVLDHQLPEDEQSPVCQEFYKTLIGGLELVKKYENIGVNPFLKCRYVFQFVNLEKQIDDFVRVMNAQTSLEVRKLVAEVRNAYLDLQPVEISSRLNESLLKQASLLTNNPTQNSMMLRQMNTDDLLGSPEMMEEDSTFSCDNTVCESSQFYVGLEKSTWNLKKLISQMDVSVVGVQCMGGGGKTTLSLALCNDPQIKGDFGSRVFFFVVSQSPNLKGILETMWEKIVGTRNPEFQNVEDAHRQLQDQIQKQSKPTLVILDDVWSRATLEKLLFEGPGYKTVVTTRDSSTLPQNLSSRLYQLPLLGEDDALALFCFWAFGEKTIPSSVDANLVKEVLAECKGLPLALKVIGSSLYGEPRVVWESAKNKLSKGEPISDYHKDGLVTRLVSSIDCLDEIARGCFLDLGSFPEDRKICVDVLLDIWVYVRNLEWEDAFVILLELARRNLLNLNLSSKPGSSAAISYGSASELYFSQHDVMRDLALYLGCQGSIINRKRLIMPKKESNLPVKWELYKNKQFDAQVVSVHTGSMDETQWFDMKLPETEALVLIFSASDYFLPPFLKSMKKLKFLMIFNYGSKRATVKGLGCLSSLAQLRSLRLERLIAPPVLQQSKALQKLEKLSLSLCEGFGNVSPVTNTDLSFRLPVSKDFNLDHCSDLEDLPPALFNMPSALTWSITNCHQVQNLPYDFGNLTSVRVLRLSALPGLKELPASIGKLVQLEYLDISQCECLKELPVEIGWLKGLKELDMRECSRLKKLPRSVLELKSLKHVICDEKMGIQWKRAKAISIKDLIVEVVEAQFSLDWLDD
uniref:TSA: Wollemia nobilis Ref_Wollemi_Transcript_28542_3059 transcribed RNA sequence n=1 Tax=Wollemia nobilis TaxID=56998 RepID=A0A0C9S3P9_9CONI